MRSPRVPQIARPGPGPVVATLAFALLAGTAAAEPGFDPWRDGARYELVYRVDLRGLPKGVERRVWVPAPADTPVQRVLSARIDSPFRYRGTRDDRGNPIVFVDASHRLAPGADLSLTFTVERLPSRGYRADLPESGRPVELAAFLAPARRIPLEGVIRRISEEEGRGLETPAERVRAYYDYVFRNMRYAKEGTGWGRGDAIWACNKKYGNCTDFHSLFLGLARAAGIPARFVIGFPVPPDADSGGIPGYHCWAEAYLPDRGWLPLDASEAWKAGDADAYYGVIPSDRVEFTLGRDLVLEPPQRGEPLNFFIYPYAEVDGQPVEKLPLEVTFRRLAVIPGAPPAGERAEERSGAAAGDAAEAAGG